MVDGILEEVGVGGTLEEVGALEDAVLSGGSFEDVLAVGVALKEGERTNRLGVCERVVGASVEGAEAEGGVQAPSQVQVSSFVPYPPRYSYASVSRH